MTSYELVASTIKGENNTGITPIYGWIFDNVTDMIADEFGSVHAFEDKYNFDMAHLFGGPSMYEKNAFKELTDAGEEITPEILLTIPMKDPNKMSDYKSIKKQLKHHKDTHERFCYVQSQGIFEPLNDVFGIENHLCDLLLYEDELKEVYKRQADWNKTVASNMIDLGVDMIHVSDDWGSQNSLMFSPEKWWELIYPNHKSTIDFVKSRGKFASLHSDGNISAVVDGIVKLGYDIIHPYQENAGMSYDTYLEKYSDKFGILGGVCVQSTLGFGDYKRLESEIRRVFSLLKGHCWVCCTTHLVQPHCSLEELTFAYELINKLANRG